MQTATDATRSTQAGETGIATRPYALLLGAILVLAFVLRVGAAAAFQGLDAPPDAGAQPDQLDYERIAFHLSEGRGYSLDGERPTALRPPGTSWALLPVYLALGRDFAAGRIWLALVSSATCLFAALFAARAFGRSAGLCAALWLALYPGHLYYPMHFLSETPYGFWMALAALAALAAASGRGPARAALAGGALALAALTRPQALLVVPLALCFVLARGARGRALPWRELTAGALAFGLLLAPWLARNQLQLGKASVSSIGGCTFWGAHNEFIAGNPTRAGRWVEVSRLTDAAHPLEGDEFEIEAACWRYGMEFVRENKARMPGLLLAKLRNFSKPFEGAPNPLAYWGFGLAWILSAPLVLAGLVLAWRACRPAALILLAPIGATLATVLIFYGSGRFRDSLAASFAPLAGLALARLLALVRRSRRTDQRPSAGRPAQAMPDTASE